MVGGPGIVIGYVVGAVCGAVAGFFKVLFGD